MLHIQNNNTMKGKEKCEKLKSIRKLIAERNMIEYTPDECSHKGECKGVCPTCDKETQYILEEIQKRLEKGQPVDLDIDLVELLTDSESEDNPATTDDDIGIDTTRGIVPDDEYLMGEAQPIEYFLQGDIAAPDDYLNSLNKDKE